MYKYSKILLNTSMKLLSEIDNKMIIQRVDREYIVISNIISIGTGIQIG